MNNGWPGGPVDWSGHASGLGGGSASALPPGQQGDLNTMYEMLNQGALDQAQFDIMMGSAMGQQGATGGASAGLGGYGQQQAGRAGALPMDMSNGGYSTAPPRPLDYLPSSGLGASSAHSAWTYGSVAPPQPTIHLNNYPPNQHSYNPYAPPPQPQPYRPPSQPSAPHPTFPTYPTPPPLDRQAPSSIPTPSLAAHCANLDRITALQSQIAEREHFVNSQARGRDPGTIAELQRQIHGLKTQQGPLIAQCQSFILTHGGHEHVAAETHAFRVARQNHLSGGRPPLQRPPQAPPIPASPLPFTLPQLAHSRAFNNLPTTPSASTPPSGAFSTSFPTPPPLPSQPLPSPHSPASAPNAQASYPPPPKQQQSSQQPKQPQQQQQQQQAPQRPPVARATSGSLPPGLRAQMDAARRAKASQPVEAKTPTSTITPLRRDVPIVPLVTKAGRDTSLLGPRQLACLPKSKEPRSATAILAEPSPGLPTLAQLQGQLSEDKFNSILPVVLRKQNISLSPPYTIGVLKHEINLYQLYQTVMINGHGGEKVTADGRWSFITTTLKVPNSEGDGLAEQLADLYRRVLAPFETVWSNALLTQRNQITARENKSMKGLAIKNGAEQPSSGQTERNPLLLAEASPVVGAGFSLSAPPPLNPPAYTYQSTSIQATDVSIAAAAEQRQREMVAAEADAKLRASVKASGQLAPFTPPGPSASPQSWLAAGAGVARSASTGSNLSRRSLGGGRIEGDRFEELKDGEADEEEARTRKRSKSGDQMMTNGHGGAFSMLPYPSSSAFTDPSQPMPLPPLQYTQPLAAPDDHLFSQYLYTGSAPSPPSSSHLRELSSSSSLDVDPPSAALGLDSSSLSSLGMGLGDWSTEGQNSSLGDALGTWEPNGAFDFERELSQWTSQ